MALPISHLIKTPQKLPQQRPSFHLPQRVCGINAQLFVMLLILIGSGGGGDLVFLVHSLSSFSLYDNE